MSAPEVAPIRSHLVGGRTTQVVEIFIWRSEVGDIVQSLEEQLAKVIAREGESSPLMLMLMLRNQIIA
jgi:hypothetical protein